MKRALILALGIVISLSSAPICRADLVLSISSPDDLSNLAVGATATFDVGVNGTAADPPGYLSASIQYDPTIFGDPVVAAGPIVPDLGGFDSSGTGGGTVAASYDDSILGTAPIASDGVFYSFTLTRLDAPATSLSFSAFAAMDDAGFVIPISASPDTITIGAAPGVPEPASLTMLLMGLAMQARRWSKRIGARRNRRLGTLDR
jgi:hypothetical protein